MPAFALFRLRRRDAEYSFRSSANTPLSSNVHFRMSRPRRSASWKKCSRESEDAPKNWANKRATVRIVSLTNLGALGSHAILHSKSLMRSPRLELSVLDVRRAPHV